MESNKENFKSLNIIFYALMAGLLFYAAIVAFLIFTDKQETMSFFGSPTNDLLAVGGYMLAMVFFSRFIDGMWQKQIPTVLKVERSPMAHYRSNVIIRLALIEGGGLFSVTFALITQNPQLLLITFLAIGAMWLARPTEEELLERYDERVS